MKSSDFGFVIAVGAFAGLAFISALCWSSVALQSMLTRIADIFPLLTDIVIAAIIGAMVFAIVKGALHLYGHAVHIKHVYPDAGGAFPLVESGKSYIDLMPESVRLVQALSDSHLAAGKKPNATAVRDAITASRAPMIDATPLPALETNGVQPFDITTVDPRNAPHYLFLGDTGSGKTTAAYSAVNQMRQTYGAKFTICDQYGASWHSQADYITDDDIAGAITGHFEIMEERLEMLREHEVQHIADIPNPPPYHVLLIEEADGLFDELIRDKRYADVLKHLRQLARMGRKAALPIITIAQTALTDIFPTHIRNNMNNVLLFRNVQLVAENWRVSKDVSLTHLPPGTAYNIRMARQIQFPLVPRPNLKNCAIRRATNSAITPRPPKNTASAGVIALPDNPQRLTVAQKRHMFNVYQSTGGYRPALRTLGLSEGGHWFYVLKEIVASQTQ